MATTISYPVLQMIVAEANTHLKVHRNSLLSFDITGFNMMKHDAPRLCFIYNGSCPLKAIMHVMNYATIVQPGSRGFSVIAYEELHILSVIIPT